jgi:hypothetical protein
LRRRCADLKKMILLLFANCLMHLWSRLLAMPVSYGWMRQPRICLS